MNLEKLSFKTAALTLLLVFSMLLLINAIPVNENPDLLGVGFLLLFFAVAGWHVVSVVADHIFDEKEGKEKKE